MVETRYRLLLGGRKIATVHLDSERRGTVVARLAPLPAFRALAQLRHEVERARDAFFGLEVATVDELTRLAEAEEHAAAALGQLPLALADDTTGAPVPAAALRVLPGEPPRLRVQW
jgi:hypothetical protein